ncbi:retrovirus-related Pol polyprotein from transposon 297 [Trichonephila clavipes]|nr:retrovirus-related Pol polyprotein from transposon 297 [Trichonephila clavipes]
MGASNCLCIQKNGSIRLCVDYRHLNSFTIADAYPMQNAKDLLFEVGQANYITVLDLTKGYWQIPMAEEAKPYTAFVTHHGHYQFCVMPFGMKNAGSTFQKVMDQVLVKHRAYCRSYIDDVAVFSKTWEQHMKHLCVVFQTIQKVGFTINLKKCNFARRRVSLAINRTDKEPSSNIIPWNEVAEQAFTKLKAQLVKAPSLYTPDLSKPYQLYTDASATAIGACLSQNDEKGKENPIAFFSKKLTETQTRWATIEREAYAVIEALKRFDSWIFGAEIEVISDHNPLTYLTLTTPQSAKLTRWALALQRYNIAISYRKGVKHGNADALSRLPIPLHRPGMTDELLRGGVEWEGPLTPAKEMGSFPSPLECGMASGRHSVFGYDGVLDMGFNRMKSIPEDAFLGNSLLTLLALDGNPLSTLSESAFKHLNSTLRGLSVGVHSNSWDAQLAVPNDPRYARLETKLGIGQAKEG